MKYLKLGFLIGCVVVLSGCQLSRLLTFKSQISQFSTYFQFEGTHTLRCLDPVLQKEDVARISGSDPHRLDVLNEREVAYYLLEKIPTLNEPTRFYDLHTRLTYEDLKLTTIHYPSQVGQLFPSELMSLALTSVGKGELSATGNEVVVTGGDVDLEMDHRELFPKQDAFLDVLGKPNRIVPTERALLWVYEYREIGPDDLIHGRPWVELGFGVTSNELISIETTIFGPFMAFDLR